MPVTGGRKLKAHLRKAQRAKSVKGVDVGFFASAQYQDGTPVANVAAKNEFGGGYSPPRPFFRQSNSSVKDELYNLLKSQVDPATLAVTPIVAELAGNLLQGNIKVTIQKLRNPPNAPSTIARKKGKSNPLIDSGLMRRSVTYKVVE